MSDVSRTQYVKLASGLINAASDPTLATCTLENCTVTRTPGHAAGFFDVHLATGMSGASALNNSKQARTKTTMRTPGGIPSVTYGTDDIPVPGNPNLVHLQVAVGAGPADADVEFEIGMIIPA